MATSETLRPTRGTEHDPTLVTGANAYDGSTATYAQLNEAVEDSQAVATWDDFPAGAIAVNKRQSVILEVFGEWSSGDTNDKVGVYIRALNGDPWTLIQNSKPPSGWGGGGGVARTFDITDVVGTEPLSSLDVQVVYENGGTGSDSTPPPHVEHGI